MLSAPHTWTLLSSAIREYQMECQFLTRKCQEHSQSGGSPTTRRSSLSSGVLYVFGTEPRGAEAPPFEASDLGVSSHASVTSELGTDILTRESEAARHQERPAGCACTQMPKTLWHRSPGCKSLQPDNEVPLGGCIVPGTVCLTRAAREPGTLHSTVK